MKLKDIYSQEFINKLNNLNVGANLNSDDEVNGVIDIETILKDLKFNFIKDNRLSGSGRIEGKSIYIDNSEILARQRFSMAHELGHAMQNNRHANRNDDSTDYNNEERKDEVFANTFAAQFLMPKKLVMSTINNIIRNNNMDRSHLNDLQVQQIIKESAIELKVSSGGMKYRMKNLEIFVPVKNGK